jgi:hypothetical protein
MVWFATWHGTGKGNADEHAWELFDHDGTTFRRPAGDPGDPAADVLHGKEWVPYDGHKLDPALSGDRYGTRAGRFVAYLPKQQHAPPGAGLSRRRSTAGYRFIVLLDHGRVRLLTRKELDWADRLPRLAKAFSRLAVTTAMLDGELVALRANGVSSFAVSRRARPHSLNSLAAACVILPRPLRIANILQTKPAAHSVNGGFLRFFRPKRIGILMQTADCRRHMTLQSDVNVCKTSCV